jgi:hypothetical protein
MVNIKLITPIPILLKKEADFSNPANSKIRGAQYKKALIPNS